VSFVAITGSTPAPPDLGVIGVDSTSSPLRLAVRGSTQEAELRSPPPRTPPAALGPGGNMVRNPYFDDGLDAGWHVSENGVATARSSRSPGWRGHSSLLLRGTGASLPGSTFVEQSFNSLPSASTGTVYDFGFVARRHATNRPVIVWMKLAYVDGTFQAVLAHQLAAGAQRSAGVPAGTDRGWHPYGAEARAAKPLVAIQLFACDTGPLRMTGILQVSAVSLAIRRVGQAPFSDVPRL